MRKNPPLIPAMVSILLYRSTIDSPPDFDYIEDNEGNDLAVLNIRKLSDYVHKQLRIRAAQHGRSMEAEARTILTEAVCGKKKEENKIENLPRLIADIYNGAPPPHTVEDLITERRKEAQKENDSP